MVSTRKVLRQDNCAIGRVSSTGTHHWEKTHNCKRRRGPEAERSSSAVWSAPRRGANSGADSRPQKPPDRTTAVKRDPDRTQDTVVCPRRPHADNSSSRLANELHCPSWLVTTQTHKPAWTVAATASSAGGRERGKARWGQSGPKTSLTLLPKFRPADCTISINSGGSQAYCKCTNPCHLWVTLTACQISPKPLTRPPV